MYVLVLYHCEDGHYDAFVALMLMTYVFISILTDPLGCIVDRLTVHRPKHRIVEKLMEMSLIQDRKQLWKKRSKMPKDGVFPGKLIFIHDDKCWRVWKLKVMT
jgi:hypothetical protein